MTSGNVDKTLLGFLLAAAVVMFVVLSKALVGLLKTFFAEFFDTLSLFLPQFLKKSQNLPACIVLSLTIIDFFLLQIEHCSTNILISLPVFLSNFISPTMIFAPE